MASTGHLSIHQVHPISTCKFQNREIVLQVCLHEKQQVKIQYIIDIFQLIIQRLLYWNNTAELDPKFLILKFFPQTRKHLVLFNTYLAKVAYKKVRSRPLQNAT